MPEAQTPVLDYGCGTGLSGVALRAAGFEVSTEWTRRPRCWKVLQKGFIASFQRFDITDPDP